VVLIKDNCILVCSQGMFMQPFVRRIIMFRKMIYLVSFVLLLSLVGDVQAVDMTWSDTTGDHLWSTAQNWDIGIVPTSADYPRIASLIGPTIANEGAVARSLSE
jgi:hypothetical protein